MMNESIRMQENPFDLPNVDIPDPIGWDNGGMMYTTHNFNVFTNPLPNEPRKTINGGTENIVCNGIPINGAFTFTMFGG